MLECCIEASNPNEADLDPGRPAVIHADTTPNANTASNAGETVLNPDDVTATNEKGALITENLYETSDDSGLPLGVVIGVVAAVVVVIVAVLLSMATYGNSTLRRYTNPNPSTTPLLYTPRAARPVDGNYCTGSTPLLSMRVPMQ